MTPPSNNTEQQTIIDAPNGQLTIRITMSTIPSSDNDTDLLYDDILEEDVKLPSTKTMIGRSKNWKATNRERSIHTDTTTTAQSHDTVTYDFMTMSTRTMKLMNKNNSIDNETFDQEYPSRSTTTSPLLNSIELVPILQEQIRQLQQENRILKRNIGILYRTAKTEIQRKDQQLLEQQQHQQR
jgi:hypothetical protein